MQGPSLLSNDCIVFFSALIETLENPSRSVCQLNISCEMLTKVKEDILKTSNKGKYGRIRTCKKQI